MKERPILFSGPMVRAILEGRKTQTRRILKGRCLSTIDFLSGRCDDEPATSSDLGQQEMNGEYRVWCAEYPEEGYETIVCPYGLTGDRLWVREAFRFESKLSDGYKLPEISCNRAHFSEPAYEASITWNKSIYGKLRPSIHMPRWASRITIEIAEVRVERLQDISVEDSLAEGITHSTLNDPRMEYAQLWNAINGPGSWDKNPWVWVIEFRRVQA